jgi:hypothetical protein
MATSTEQHVNVRFVYVHPLSQIVLQCLQNHCHDWIQSKQLHERLQLHVDGTFTISNVSPTVQVRDGTTTTTTTPSVASIIAANRTDLSHPETLLPTPPGVTGTTPSDTAVSSELSHQPIPLHDDSKTTIGNPTKNKSYYSDRKNAIQIWTTYDMKDRKHWLYVTVKDTASQSLSSSESIPTHQAPQQQQQETEKLALLLFQNRYLLQDNSLTPWQTFSKARGKSIPERIHSSVYELIQAVDAVGLLPTTPP